MPLSGIRILDLSQAISGPVTTRILADLGAEVIKIETPVVGEAARRMGAIFLNGHSGYFMTFNRNKRSVTLNLQSEEGQQIFYRLARVSDMVMDNFRPGVTSRLKIDYKTLKAVNPSIICCSITGYGKEGPYSSRPAFDSVIQGLSGAMSVTGEEGGPPGVMGFAVTDVSGGYGGAIGALAALMARERTGEGQEVDISLLDVMLTFQGHLAELYLGGGQIPAAHGSVQSANLPNGAFETKDGRHVQIHCATQKFYETLAQELSVHVPGLEGLPQDERFIHIDGRRKNWTELKALLENAFKTKTRDEWIQLIADTVPIAPVNDLSEALSDPQVLLRNMVVETDHPEAGKFKTHGNPIKLGQEEVFFPAPILGQHNQEVLGGLLGYSDSEIDALKDRGIV